MLQDLQKDALISIASLLSASSIKKFIDGDFSAFRYRISKHFDIQEGSTYKDIVESLYEYLLRNYRNEYFYKNKLLHSQLSKYKTSHTVVFDEFTIWSSIADFVLLNGEVKIFEVKTELDTLDKLEKQINDYRKFANKVYIVSSKKLLAKIIEEYKDTNIGIIEFTNRNTLKTVQEAIVDMTRFDHDTIFKTLRKDEYLNLIENYFNTKVDVPNTKQFRYCLDLAKNIEVTKFQKLAFERLKERKKNVSYQNYLKTAPEALRYSCYNIGLDSKELQKLNQYLNTKVS